MIAILTVAFAGCSVWAWQYYAHRPGEQGRQPIASQPPIPSTPAPAAKLVGQTVNVAGVFAILVPGAWRASVSTAPSFTAIQFARPGSIDSLAYDSNAPAAVDYDGISAWDGLTEHFYVRAITSASQAFDPARHAQVISEPFTFNDGTIGIKYSVTKTAAEAQQWGGLLKDDSWHGRVYSYQKDGSTVEAHLAYYPSTNIDHAVFERVAATITK